MDTRKILLVEDNEDQILLTLQALEDNGVETEVVVAQDGQEALDYLHGTGAHSGLGYGNGANSYVQKPVRYHDLSDAVRQIASYWLSLNISPVRSRNA